MTPGRRGRRRSRRGESLVEVTAALVLFGLAIHGLGLQWVHVGREQRLAQEHGVLASVLETAFEEARLVGAKALPLTPLDGAPWKRLHYDAQGAPALGPTEAAYEARIWVTEAPPVLADGTTLMREVTVRVYQGNAALPRLTGRTLLIPLAFQ